MAESTSSLGCRATTRRSDAFRQVLGEAGVEQLLKTTIEAAVNMGAIKRSEFERVIVDTTVQEKAVAHPSAARVKVVVAPFMQPKPFSQCPAGMPC